MMGLVWRFILSVVLVYISYNPEGYSFYHWVIEPAAQGKVSLLSAFTPFKILVGFVVFIAWGILIVATRKSLGAVGLVVTALFLGCVLWCLIYYDIISVTNMRLLLHEILLLISVLLTIGLSWSHFSRKLTGRTDADIV